MGKGILARKVGMTQIFTERGTVVPVTVLEFELLPRRAAQDHACRRLRGAADRLRREVQPKRVNKPLTGHFRRAGVRPLRRLTELRDAGEAELGSRLRVEMFSEGELVDVTGVSQGKGFAGTVKRHGFSRGPVSHGSMNTRQPGSIGSVDAARTFKGVKMSGQYGNVRRTVRRLEVVRVDGERNLLLVKGSVPGHKNTVVLVRPSEPRGAVVTAVSVVDQTGTKSGELELSEAIFGVTVNTAVMHQALIRQLANARQGTHDTKTRTEVRGGGKKPWRQKGTGRARQGSIRSPQWAGGGVVFGPTPRSYRQEMPRKQRRLALRSALSAKAQDGHISVLSGFEARGAEHARGRRAAAQHRGRGARAHRPRLAQRAPRAQRAQPPRGARHPRRQPLGARPAHRRDRAHDP